MAGGQPGGNIKAMETTFANTPRIKNKPFSKRVGDNLLKRDDDGNVQCLIGHYSPSQILARKAFAKRLRKSLKVTWMAKMQKGEQGGDQ